MPQPPVPTIRYNLLKRLEFLEYRLFWEGQINRGDLVEMFGISVPQASADLSKYQELAPGNVEYDRSRKTYLPTGEFQPQYMQPSGDSYLAKLRLRESGIENIGDSWESALPEYSVMPILRRTVRAEFLRHVVAAIRGALAMKISYQSATSSSSSWRWITPHAFGFDGYRWHVRAWCQRNEQYRDFVLTRFVDVGGLRTFDDHTPPDLEWDRVVTFELEPNPRLSDGARRAVEMDYGMVDGRTSIDTRVSLSFYLERHMGLDQDESTTAPERLRMILANRQAVEAIRREARSSQH